jgi:hypothetical protein
VSLLNGLQTVWKAEPCWLHDTPENQCVLNDDIIPSVLYLAALLKIGEIIDGV